MTKNKKSKARVIKKKQKNKLILIKRYRKNILFINIQHPFS